MDPQYWGALALRRVSLLLPLCALVNGSCDAIWGARARDSAENCVVRPDSCQNGQFCNQETEVCQDLDLVILSAEPAVVSTSGGQVTLHGRGFQSGGTVTIGGASVPADLVTVVSATELLVTVPARPASCGPVPVRFTRTDGTSTEQADLLRYVPAQLRFQPPQGYQTGGSLLHLMSADLNGDGAPDVVAADYDASGGIVLAYGDGQGRLTIDTDRTDQRGWSVFSVAAADVNGDSVAARESIPGCDSAGANQRTDSTSDLVRVADHSATRWLHTILHRRFICDGWTRSNNSSYVARSIHEEDSAGMYVWQRARPRKRHRWDWCWSSWRPCPRSR